jgi:hypothetical protein
MLVFEAPGSLWITVAVAVFWFASFNVPAVYVARAFHLRLWWLALIPHLESTILVPRGYRKPVIILYWALPVVSFTALLILVSSVWTWSAGQTGRSWPSAHLGVLRAGVCRRIGEFAHAFIASIRPLSILDLRIAADVDQAAGGGNLMAPRTNARTISPPIGAAHASKRVGAPTRPVTRSAAIYSPSPLARGEGAGG